VIRAVSAFQFFGGQMNGVVDEIPEKAKEHLEDNVNVIPAARAENGAFTHLKYQDGLAPKVFLHRVRVSCFSFPSSSRVISSYGLSSLQVTYWHQNLEEETGKRIRHVRIGDLVFFEEFFQALHIESKEIEGRNDVDDFDVGDGDRMFLSIRDGRHGLEYAQRSQSQFPQSDNDYGTHRKDEYTARRKFFPETESRELFLGSFVQRFYHYRLVY